MPDFAQARRTMVESQLRTFDVTDRAVLAAALDVPRERFMPAGHEGLAYVDRIVPVRGPAGTTRVLLAPMILARLIQALDLAPGARVLDVAGGTGYAAALMAAMGAEVTSLEDEGFRLPGAAFPDGIVRRSGPVAEGCPDLAPFDAILINGAVEERPAGLLAQLADGGRLGCLRRDGRAGRAMLYVRTAGISEAVLFDAPSPVLPEFAAEPAFVF